MTRLLFIIACFFTIPLSCLSSWPYIDSSVRLSFDDWPNERTIKIVDLLKEKKRVWHFYLVGRKVLDNPEIVKYTEKNNVVCNHTRSHKDLSLLGYNEIVREIWLWSIAIKDVLWYSPDCFRPPYWKKNSWVDYISQRFGMRMDRSMSNGVLDSMDRKTKNRKEIVKTILGATWYNEIVFHDSEETYYALKTLLK